MTQKNGDGFHYCSVPKVPERVLAPNVGPARAALIIGLSNKWANGTTLHYYFFDKPTDRERVFFSDGTSEWRTWTGGDSQKRSVRQAFDVWKSVGIGLKLQEVASREDAEIRIGFMQGDGAWSYLGRQILNRGVQERTMNFGWNIGNDVDTPIHEIGHTLGFPHEHQNPNAGIVWDEEAVYSALAQPPNRWPRDKTFHNIIRKINPDTVQGSNWDPNSIMHYPFEPGLIKEPAEFNRNGLDPAPGLSDRDKTWVNTFYPPLAEEEEQDPALEPFTSVELALAPGEQKNFTISPPETRKYEIGTFGASDTVMVLFEDDDGELRYVAGDDDSGTDTNARIKLRLFKGRRYVLRIRLYWSAASGQTAVMMW